MNCQEVQVLLSLYLYGELDFAREEQLENHLVECAACQLSLAREKQWHTLTNAQIQEPALDLLADCRQHLRPALARETTLQPSPRSWWRWTNPFEISGTRWSAQLALASLLVFIGFASAHWFERGALRPSATAQMSILNPAGAHIRDIQSDDAGVVRIVLEQEREITGRIGDSNIRNLLLSGTRQPDPSVRFYSLQVLTGQGSPQDGRQGGNDLKDVLFYSVRNDPNPAVRLQAIEGLRRFSADPTALETLKFVLQHDDNPGVRSQAIDVLAPLDADTAVTPAMAQTILDVMRSSQGDEYVHARCSQVLEEAKLPVVY
jgi:anti-sigma factor RsiW